jgi:hypothetical protein
MNFISTFDELNKLYESVTSKSYAVAKTPKPVAKKDHFYFNDSKDVAWGSAAACYSCGPLSFLTAGYDLFDSIDKAEAFAKEVLRDNYFYSAYVIDVTDPTAFKCVCAVDQNRRVKEACKKELTKAPVVEKEEVTENFDNESGSKAWNKKSVIYYTQAAKDLGLTDFDMKAVSVGGGKQKAIITAKKNGKQLSTEADYLDTIEDINNASDAKEFLKYIFGGLSESVEPEAEELTEAAEDEEIEIEIAEDDEAIEDNTSDAEEIEKTNAFTVGEMIA